MGVGVFVKFLCSWQSLDISCIELCVSVSMEKRCL